MTLRFRLNPLERDEYGNIHDYEKTWICFTVTVKKAPDARDAADAFEFVEWYLNEKSDIPCALLGCAECVNGVHTDIITFDRIRSKSKRVQTDELRAALDEAKAAYFRKMAAAIPPYILAATRKTA